MEEFRCFQFVQIKCVGDLYGLLFKVVIDGVLDIIDGDFPFMTAR